MKKLLVLTDFSSPANKALDFALQVAKQAKAEIYLVHCCDLLDTTFKDRLTLKKEYNKGLLNKANEKLSDLKRSIEDTEEIKVNTIIYNGSPTDCIIQAEEEIGVDFIIMGTRGETELTESMFGSTTGNLIEKTKDPLIVVTRYTK